ncbi:hypothetical protein AAFF_G00200960 [Aldrovandia affinis]|uniref:Uncharacterized protein n=1 Tax=Aldrovandia affinis TaxID=143900 RepID=A0AAD7RHS1_9TELE|nr:hypothetical protein AAFF_G00200960 [Aldrovandia affinis]
MEGGFIGTTSLIATATPLPHLPADTTVTTSITSVHSDPTCRPNGPLVLPRLRPRSGHCLLTPSSGAPHYCNYKTGSMGDRGPHYGQLEPPMSDSAGAWVTQTGRGGRTWASERAFVSIHAHSPK